MPRGQWTVFRCPMISFPDVRCGDRALLQPTERERQDARPHLESVRFDCRSSSSHRSPRVATLPITNRLLGKAGNLLVSISRS